MSLWGTTDNAASKPKWLDKLPLRNDQTVSDKDATYGVSREEAAQAINREAGIKTPGWVETRTYTDAQGNVRHKTEVLVAFAGDMTSDAADDQVVSDRTIRIGTQPVAASVVAGGTATFTVVATVTPTTTLTYQWQKQESGSTTWSNILDATSASYTTGALTVADDNGDKYRVIVGAADAKNITSKSATLTVTAA